MLINFGMWWRWQPLGAENCIKVHDLAGFWELDQSLQPSLFSRVEPSPLCLRNFCRIEDGRHGLFRPKFTIWSRNESSEFNQTFISRVSDAEDRFIAIVRPGITRIEWRKLGEWYLNITRRTIHHQREFPITRVSDKLDSLSQNSRRAGI